MTTIASADAALYRLPLPVTFSDSTHGAIADFELALLTVRDADGVEGTGYTYTVGKGGSAILALLRDHVAPALAGADAEAPEAARVRLDAMLHWGGRGGATTLALSAADMALWDLLAKRAGRPLWRLLGGHDASVACYAGGIDLDFTVDALLAQADGFLAAGHRAIKMKVGRARLSEDVARVEAMRRHLGEDFPLMADANMKWRVHEAVEAARALAPYRLVWLEEPINPDDFEGHRRVVEEGGVPVATGENLRSVAEFRRLIAGGGVSFPEPDATNCGGIGAFMKVAHLAEAFHLPLTSHGAHDVTVHCLAATPAATFLEIHGFSIDPYVEDPLVVREGRVRAPDRPGHGILFDRARLARHLAG